MPHPRPAWNATSARSIISDPAFADRVNFHASKSTCIRLLVALCADATAWVTKTTYHRGAAPYLLMRPDTIEYGAHLEPKITRVDVDTLISLGLLRETELFTDSYLSSPIECSLVLTDAGRAFFASPEGFVAAVERVTAERAKQRARHSEVGRVEADVGPVAQVIQARAISLGIRLFACAGSLEAARLDALPPEFAEVRDILEEARRVAPAYADCIRQLAQLDALRCGAAPADPDRSDPIGSGMAL